MKSRTIQICRALLISVIFAFFSRVPAFPVDYEGKIVGKITVVSNVNFNDNKIIGFLGLEEGDPLSKETIRSSFREIFELGFFRDIKFVLAEFGDEQLELTIVIDELEKIKNIEFIGNQKFASETLKEELLIQPYDYFSKSSLNAAVNQIKDKYREDGYLMTKVKTDLKFLPETKEVEITFDIDEGAEMLVGKITLIGNKNIRDKDILKEIETKEDKWYREGKFDDALFEEDKNIIIQYYKKKGYINAKILKTSISYRWRNPRKKKARDAYIFVNLYEGEKYFFGDLTIKGNSLFTEEEIRKNLQRKKGEVFNQEIHEMDIQAIKNMYMNRGYIFAQITPIEYIDKETRKISYVFDIYEGDKAHVERIFVTGNEKTKDYVILRELVIREGEIFNADKIRISAENLMRLGYFKNVVPEPRQGSVEGLMNLVIKIEEQQTGMVQAGAGFGTKSGFSLNFELRENNLKGKGQSLALRANVGQRSSVVSVSFTEPWILKKPISLQNSLSYSWAIDQNSFKNYTDYALGSSGEILTNTSRTPELYYINEDGIHSTNSLGIDFWLHRWSLSTSLGYRFRSWYRISGNLGLNFQTERYGKSKGRDDQYLSQWEIAQYCLSNDMVGPLNKKIITTLNMGLGFSRDNRNNILSPTKGSRLSLDLDLIALDYDLTKMHLHFSAFHTVFWKFIVAYLGDLETFGKSITGKFNYDSKYYYYFMREELRGWDPEDIRDFNLYESSYQDAFYEGMGKRKHTFELRVALHDYFSLVGFLDLARMSRGRMLSPDEFKNHFNPFAAGDYMGSTGFGVAVNIPMFPIRLFWSWKFHADQKKLKGFNQLYGKNGHPLPVFVFTVAGFF